ncbi:lysine-N-methylase [Rossellomorea marisflavi]|uniref:Lysine-N-methylase n=1 Tax=Rossellomorea marisflavi TaxID=189381 RepID=A0A5D4S5Z4_9BACI|nr:flagellin lysine-N-methylase [Rossellomorea marisflavi]TYS57136.1 lysine-N-methylase [Rossellomorea marisflavi]
MKTLQPIYMEKFACIGPQCEDTCCANWTISIDKKSYKKYRKINDLDFKEKFKSGVSKNKTLSNSQDSFFARMNLNDQGQCSFLTEEKLCGIQQQYGENHLCSTCAIYPRMVNKLNDSIEKSGLVSCPEIARLALLNKEGIDFKVVELDKKTTFLNGELSTNLYKEDSIERNYWDIRYFIIQVLQNRSIKLWERLLYIGLFVQKLQETKNESVQVHSVVSTFKNNLVAGNVSDLFKNVPVNLEMQFKVLKLITESRSIEGIHHPRFKEYYSKFLNGIKYSNENSDEENFKNYNISLEHFRKEEENYEYIFENYLVNYVFQTMFPLNTEGDYLKEYSYLILHYSLIKLHLIGIKSSLEDSFSDQDIVSFIQSFARNIGHNKAYLNKVYNFLKENKLNNLGSYSLLVKN